MKAGILALAVLLAAAAGWTDYRSRRIPNWLTVPGVLVGIAVNILTAGWSGLKTSLLGVGLGLLLLLPFVLLRSLGAGEVILITPATTSPAPDGSTTGDPAFNSPWSYTGLPTVSVPTGQFVEGLPLAIQLVLSNRQDSEAAGLFRAAAWVEKALGVGPLTPPLPR